jgi:hypothetical protein
MAVNQKVGEFQLRTSPGTQSITGLGFQPKVVLFFHTPDTVDIASQTANYNMSIGADDGTSKGAICEFAPNGNSGAETNYVAQCYGWSIVGSVDASSIWRAGISSMDADGFTITVAAAPTLGYRVGYMAMGGVGMTGVKVGYFPMTTGVQTISGLGFQPTGLIAFSAGLTSLPLDPAFGGSHASSVGIGFSDGALMRGHGEWHRASGVSVKVRARTDRNDNMLAAPLSSTGYAYAFSFGAFNADGFTISNNVNGGSAYAFYVAFNGATVSVGNITSPAVTGAFSITGLSFNPNAVLMASSWQPTYNSIIGGGTTPNGPGSMLSLGFGTASTEQLTMGATAIDFTVTSVEAHHSDSTKLMKRYSTNPFTTLEMDFALANFGTGQIDLMCTTASATTSVISYMAIQGDAITPPTPPTDPTGGSGGPDSPDSIFLMNFV